jgi:hypothetical protein
MVQIRFSIVSEMHGLFSSAPVHGLLLTIICIIMQYKLKLLIINDKLILIKCYTKLNGLVYTIYTYNNWLNII